MKPTDAVSLIETAYKLDFSTAEWLERIAATASAALGSELGAMAFLYDASSGDWVVPGAMALYRMSPLFVRDFFSQTDISAEGAKALTRVFKAVRFGILRPLLARPGFTGFGEILDRHGVEDMVGINGLDPTGRGCMLAIIDRKRTHSPRTVNLWHRLAAHISAGNRLRSTIEKLAPNGLDSTQHAEAVLTPNGKVEHATGPAEPRAAREALRDALIRIDTARSEKDDAGRSVELWRGLVSGRWSLVEHFERDGKRYFLAHKNDPELTHDRALTERERQVLGYAELGHTNKLIGYALGLSTSTVSTLLARARKKLGISE